MAEVITRSIPAIPYQGGTLRTAQPYSAAVRLSATRMVWTYSQTGPDWRFFVIVDTPEGWANGGTPVVTVSRMQDQKSYRGNSLHMARLNDNAFVVFDAQSASGTAWSYEVFEINADNVFTRTASNLDAYDTITTTVNLAHTQGNVGTTGAKFNNVMTVMTMVDNTLLIPFFSGTGAYYSTMVYNPTTKVVTFPVSGNGLGSVGYTGTQEVYSRLIPGSTKRSVTFRTTNIANTWSGTSTSFMTVIFNADNTIFGTFNSATNALGNPAVNPATDSVALSDTRVARLNWTWAYYYGQTSGTLVNDGFGSYTNTTSINPMIALPMDSNYLMAIDRTHFASSTSGNLKVKIIRRDDANMVSQSPGSAASATGFDVTATYIQPWFNDPRPRIMSNGDVFWWGLDNSGALAWNILKNAS